MTRLATAPLQQRTRVVTEAEAFAELDRVYGSLDDFLLRFYSLPDDRQELFYSGQASWDAKAASLGLTKATTIFLFLKSDTFSKAMTQFAARDAWNGLAQRRAMATLARDVQDTSEKIPHRVAGMEFLTKQIAPEQKEQPEEKGRVININIGDGNASLASLRAMIEQQEVAARTITIEGLPDGFEEEAEEDQEAPETSYRPGRSGDEPPEGVRQLEAARSRRLETSSSFLPKAYGAPLGQAQAGARSSEGEAEGAYGGRVSQSVGESPTDNGEGEYGGE